MRKDYWFTSLKLCAAVFNGTATYLIFFSIFMLGGRGTLFAGVSAALAVILVDLFFIVALIMLEDKTVNIRERIVWGVSATLLAIATLAIGVADEGLLGLVPRAGFVLLVAQDVLSVYSDWELEYNSRPAKEQRIRDTQVILRAEEKAKAYRRVIQGAEIKAAFEAKILEQELKNLEVNKPTPFSEPVTQPIVEQAEQYIQELEQGIVQTDDGFGWVNRDGELMTTTALGKPYSYQGAKNALSRAKNNNGHR